MLMSSVSKLIRRNEKSRIFYVCNVASELAYPRAITLQSMTEPICLNVDKSRSYNVMMEETSSPQERSGKRGMACYSNISR